MATPDEVIKELASIAKACRELAGSCMLDEGILTHGIPDDESNPIAVTAQLVLCIASVWDNPDVSDEEAAQALNRAAMVFADTYQLLVNRRRT